MTDSNDQPPHKPQKKIKPLDTGFRLKSKLGGNSEEREMGWMEKNKMIKPIGGVSPLIELMGGVEQSLTLLKSMGYGWVTRAMVELWKDTNVMPFSVHESISYMARTVDIIEGGQFIEVQYKKATLGQFYMAPEVSIRVKKLKW